MEYQESIKKNLRPFFEDPTRDKLRRILAGIDAENDYIEFKREWEDVSKIAKEILAMTNSGGGIIVVGVAEEESGLDPIGLDEERDKSDIRNGLDGFIPESLREEIYDIETFNYSSADYPEIGEMFQVVFVNHKPELLPAVSADNGSEITENRVYVRDGTRCAEANYTQLQRIIQENISINLESSSGEISEEMRELRTLYSFKKSPFVKKMFGGSYGLFQSGQEFYNFLDKLIEKKKRKIENSLGVEIESE